MRRPVVTAVQRLAETKWLRLETLKYADATGRTRSWDRVTRNTKIEDERIGSRSSIIDAVAILPVLRDGGEDGGIGAASTILVKQYRPPLDTYTIELPAGLIDRGESPQEAAVRELREETGYVGNADDCSVTGALPLSPGLSDETVALVTVPIDLTLSENKNPIQDLHDGEDIELMKVPLSSLMGTLERLNEDENVSIFLGLHCIAMGVEWGKVI